MTKIIYAQAALSLAVNIGDVLCIEQQDDGRCIITDHVSVADLLEQNRQLRAQIVAERSLPKLTVHEVFAAMPKPKPKLYTAQPPVAEQFKFGNAWLPREGFLAHAARVLKLPYARDLFMFFHERPEQFLTLRKVRQEAGARIHTPDAASLSKCNYAWKRLAETGLLQSNPHRLPNPNKHHEQHRLGMTQQYADTVGMMLLDWMTGPSGLD